MGLDAGFRTREGTELFYFRKFYELDDFITNNCNLSIDPIYDNDGNEIPNEDYEYIVKLSDLEPLKNVTTSVYNILSKYSERIIDLLDEGDQPSEFKPEDRAALEDVLYSVPEFREVSSSFFLTKCIRLFYFLSFLTEGEIKEELIYWRSY